jgi:hypothetical protein
MAKQLLPVHAHPASEFANAGEVNEADGAALSSATGREEGLAEDETLSDFEAEVLDHEGGALPMSEVTGGPQGGTPEEDKDGLNEVERALRDAAEAPIGRREVGE